MTGAKRVDRRAFLGATGAAVAGLARAAERDWSGRAPVRYPTPTS